MATTLYAWRLRSDDGNETTATWLAAQNTPAVVARDTNFRVRFGVQNDTSAIANLDVRLSYSLNDVDWVDVSGTSTVVRSSASPNVADAANLTEQLTGGSGVFEGATAFDEVNGICGGTSYDIAATEHFEHEFCCQVRSADVASGTAIYLRSRNNDSGNPWTTYNSVAILYADWLPLTAALSDARDALADSIAFTLSEPPDKSIQFSDPAENLADSLASLRMGFLTANLPADAMTMADALEILHARNVDLSDAAANLDDLIAALEIYFVGLQSDANQWADSPDVFLDTVGGQPQNFHTVSYRTF